MSALSTVYVYPEGEVEVRMLGGDAYITVAPGVNLVLRRGGAAAVRAFACALLRQVPLVAKPSESRGRA